MDKLLSLLINKLLDEKIIDAEKTEIYRTGFMLMFSDIINIALIIFAGLVTKTFVWSVIYLSLMWTVRRFSGGFHAKTYWLCRTVTVGTYIIIMAIGKIIYDNYILFSSIGCLFCLVTMLAFSPVRHPNKELSATEEKANKLFSLITTFLCSILSIILSAYKLKIGLIISLTLLAIAILMYAGLLTNRKEGQNAKEDNK